MVRSCSGHQNVKMDYSIGPWPGSHRHGRASWEYLPQRASAVRTHFLLVPQWYAYLWGGVPDGTLCGSVSTSAPESPQTYRGELGEGRVIGRALCGGIAAEAWWVRRSFPAQSCLRRETWARGYGYWKARPGDPCVVESCWSGLYVNFIYTPNNIALPGSEFIMNPEVCRENAFRACLSGGMSCSVSRWPHMDMASPLYTDMQLRSLSSHVALHGRGDMEPPCLLHSYIAPAWGGLWVLAGSGDGGSFA